MTDYILDTVHRLQKKLHTKDPFEAAKNLGIHVLYRNLNNLKGFYTLRCRERYIVINESLSQNEQKIVCAHELGHDRLHRHFAQYTPLQDLMIYDMTLKPEREANIFATEFLLSDSDILDNAELFWRGRALYPTEITADAATRLTRGCPKIEKNRLIGGF